MITALCVVQAPTLLATSKAGAVALLGGRLMLPAWLGAGGRFAVALGSPLFLLALFWAQSNAEPHARTSYALSAECTHRSVHCVWYRSNGVPAGSGLSKGFDMNVARWGENAAWQAYDKATPRLIPNLKSIGAFFRGSIA